MDSQSNSLGIIANICSQNRKDLEKELRERNISPLNKNKGVLIKYATYFNRKYIKKLQFQSSTIMISETSLPASAETKPPIVPTKETTKSFDLTGWKIRYNGTTNVEEFIDRIEETATIRNIPTEILHRNFIDLISHELLSWHKIHKTKVKSWPELKAALLKSFAPKEAQHRIKSALFSIKQLPEETVSQYTQRADVLNIKLASPITETELIPVITDGLLAKYENIATSLKISSLEQLKDACLLLENYQDKKRNIKPSNSPLIPSLSSRIKPEFNEKKFCSFCKRAGHSQSSCFKQAKLSNNQDNRNHPKRSRDRSPQPDNLREIFKRSRNNMERIHPSSHAIAKPPSDFSKPPPNWAKRNPKN